MDLEWAFICSYELGCYCMGYMYWHIKYMEEIDINNQLVNYLGRIGK
jgi:hypothetical protein